MDTKKGQLIKVLLVEDIPIIQKHNKFLLESLNCKVTIAVNGEEAVNKAEQRYDMIFMDLDLPDFDGITVSKKIRGYIHHADTPIIALTASGYAREHDCKQAGIDDFILKPLEIKKLGYLINKWKHWQDSIKKAILSCWRMFCRRIGRRIMQRKLTNV